MRYKKTRGETQRKTRGKPRNGPQRVAPKHDNAAVPIFQALQAAQQDFQDFTLTEVSNNAAHGWGMNRWGGLVSTGKGLVVLGLCWPNVKPLGYSGDVLASLLVYVRSLFATMSCGGICSALPMKPTM
jgi:hypothetical protein